MLTHQEIKKIILDRYKCDAITATITTNDLMRDYKKGFRTPAELTQYLDRLEGLGKVF